MLGAAEVRTASLLRGGLYGCQQLRRRICVYVQIDLEVRQIGDIRRQSVLTEDTLAFLLELCLPLLIKVVLAILPSVVRAGDGKPAVVVAVRLLPIE